MGADAAAIGHKRDISSPENQYTLTNVTKRFGTQVVLRGLDLQISAGGFVAITGCSGSGKSTLLHLLAGLDIPSSGSVRFRDSEFANLSDHRRTAYRRREIGIVFQSLNLIPALTTAENIALPAVIAGQKLATYRERLASLLAELSLEHVQAKLPRHLSGGEAQRAAIGRALFGDPQVILADEPTGHLDAATTVDVLRLLRQAHTVHGHTTVIVTHDPLVAASADSVLVLQAGRIADTFTSPYGLGPHETSAASWTSTSRA